RVVLGYKESVGGNEVVVCQHLGNTLVCTEQGLIVGQVVVNPGTDSGGGAVVVGGHGGVLTCVVVASSALYFRCCTTIILHCVGFFCKTCRETRSIVTTGYVSVTF